MMISYTVPFSLDTETEAETHLLEKYITVS